MDETEPDDVVVTVGQRLKEAREAKGLSVEDVAAQTRIPTRHLVSLEESDWDKLPAATYSVGFAKNYAGVVGLDRNEISEALRAEMGGTRPTTVYPEVYEAVDPARTMPKGLVIAALGLLVLVVLGLSWLSNRSIQADESVAEAARVTEPAENTVVAAPAPPPAAAAVELTATDAVWLEIKDGTTLLKQGQMAPGETFAVPSGAVAPILTTGKPEALRIMVGSTQAPPIGPAGRRVSNVSLKATDLMQPGAATPTAQPATPAQAQPAQVERPRRTTPPAPPVQAPEPAAPQGNTSAANPGNAAQQ